MVFLQKRPRKGWFATTEVRPSADFRAPPPETLMQVLMETGARTVGAAPDNSQLYIPPALNRPIRRPGSAPANECTQSRAGPHSDPHVLRRQATRGAAPRRGRQRAFSSGAFWSLCLVPYTCLLSIMQDPLQSMVRQTHHADTVYR